MKTSELQFKKLNTLCLFLVCCFVKFLAVLQFGHYVGGGTGGAGAIKMDDTADNVGGGREGIGGDETTIMSDEL